MPDDIKCQHCGQNIAKEQIDQIISQHRTPESSNVNEDEMVNRITKKAVAEVISTIQPLLDKLQEIGGQQAEVNAANNPLANQEQQLQNLQAAAKDRLKQMEQRVADRMKKFQKHTNKA